MSKRAPERRTVFSRSGRDSNPRASSAGCFQGSCNQPDSATAPKRFSGRSFHPLRPAKRSLTEVFPPISVQDVEPVVSVRLRELYDVALRVRMDSAQADLLDRRVLAFDAEEWLAVVNDEVIRSRLGERKGNVVAQGRERVHSLHGSDVALSLGDSHAL